MQLKNGLGDDAFTDLIITSNIIHNNAYLTKEHRRASHFLDASGHGSIQRSYRLRPHGGVQSSRFDGPCRLLLRRRVGVG